MIIEERIQDILELEQFNDEEIEHVQNDMYFVCFKSWEYYQIFHLTNEELHHLDEGSQLTLESADCVEDTKAGKIYCFK